MEWIERLNATMNYIEERLADEIEYEQIAKIACCSIYHYQRMFGYMAGVTLAEYIKRRRMSRAAADLRGGKKVVDVALDYGYDSPTAFNRAFQSVHGVTPSLAKQKGVTLKTYPPISFKMTIKGVEEMNYRIEEKAPFRVVGLREPITNDAEEAFKCVPLFWQKTAPQIPQIIALMSGEPKGLLGVSTCNEVEGKQNYYYIAVASDKPVSDGMTDMVVPASTWAIFPGNGTPEDLQALQVRIVSEWLPTSGYEWANAPDVEVYLGDDHENMQFEVWLPVVKKQ